MSKEANRRVQLAYKPYTRLFKRPLQTAHGLWRQRQGIVLRVVDACGRVGFGEVAPLPWFGTESRAMALEFLASLPPQVTREQLSQVPPHLPACEFAIATALQFTSMPPPSLPPEQICALLPTGPDALTAWPVFWRQGHRTFKWKVGVHSLEQELAWFQALQIALPAETQLRLDANGGLSQGAAEVWLAACDASPRVEFLEQPLPPQDWRALQDLSRRYQTPLALDESVANGAQLQACCQRGWGGIVVVKPAIAGHPQRLKALCRRYAVDVVVSSVFETGIGRQAILQLAVEMASRRAFGMGTRHRCHDNWDDLGGDALWQQL